jgi:hypothetical protein
MPTPRKTRSDKGRRHTPSLTIREQFMDWFASQNDAERGLVLRDLETIRRYAPIPEATAAPALFPAAETALID